jgi:hypothetical protein
VDQVSVVTVAMAEPAASMEMTEPTALSLDEMVSVVGGTFLFGFVKGGSSPLNWG